MEIDFDRLGLELREIFRDRLESKIEILIQTQRLEFTFDLDLNHIYTQMLFDLDFAVT